MKISFRQATQSDKKFLWNLHKLTMKEYVDEVWGWEENFQKEYFTDRFEAENIRVIQKGETSIGAIEIHHKEEELFISDFKIEPSYQNEGIGTTIIKRLINSSAKQRLKLQVLKVNPAKQFYKKLGFEVVKKTETHFIMERSVV